ncbi:hypothetical protein K2X05_02360 [bacterium]|nr:hypothetical protein [bacterium]
MKYSCLISGLFFVSSVSATEPICASSYAELEKTNALKNLRSMIPDKGVRGFVNGTRGSYFFIRTNEQEIHLTFLTTGIFDLYGIRKDGHVRFCDIDGKVFIFGLGNEQEVFVDAQSIQFSDRSPRHFFQPGPLPDLLKEKHDLSDFENR